MKFYIVHRKHYNCDCEEIEFEVLFATINHEDACEVTKLINRFSRYDDVHLVTVETEAITEFKRNYAEKLKKEIDACFS